MKKLSLLFTALLFICIAQGQNQTSKLYVAGTVLSDEKMLVTVRETKFIEGNVVSAEMNGKKTEAKTDKNGHALLDFSAISASLVNPTVAVIKSFDKDGKLLGTANTTVQPGIPGIIKGPVMENLPANLPKGEEVTIPGKNLGADAQLVIGEQFQETLSASDKEITTFTDCKTGTQPAYVITPNGVSQSQTVNVYSLDFALAKNSIKPRENVQAQVHYESIPEGTKLIFSNKSPETINMTIPGAVNTANECIYTVSDKNGTIPVNITGIIRGNFKIALDLDFKNEEKDSHPVKPSEEQKPADNENHPEKPPVTQPELKTETCVCKSFNLNVGEVKDPLINSSEELTVGFLTLPKSVTDWFNGTWEKDKTQAPPKVGPKLKIKYIEWSIDIPVIETLDCAGEETGMKKNCGGWAKQVFLKDFKTEGPPPIKLSFINSDNRQYVHYVKLSAKCGEQQSRSLNIRVNLRVAKPGWYGCPTGLNGHLILIFKIVCDSKESTTGLDVEIMNGIFYGSSVISEDDLKKMK